MNTRKRVLICHERFLPRFGADRVLIIIGEHLRRRGWMVDFLGKRFPDDRLDHVAHELIEIPDPVDYIHFDLQTSPWVAEWLEQRAKSGVQYDWVVVGGWPFFSSIPHFRKHAERVVFIDCGVVPNEGYEEGTQRILDHLRELRRQHLTRCTHIAPNSRFTMDSQSLPETAGAVPCRPVLNGIDHLSDPGQGGLRLPDRALLQVRSLKAQGHPVILLLGRFELKGYKNSRAGLECLRILRRAIPAARMVVLDRPESLALDWELQDAVIGLGFPDDATLVDIMSEVDLGISVSLWEGFNLPIAEMYRLGRPALCFNLAAHPEVVLRPWFLCDHVVEMAAKAALIISRGSPNAQISASDVTEYRARFTWEKFMFELDRLLET